MKAIDLIGLRFGRLTAVRGVSLQISSGTRALFWECECDCGGTTLVRSQNLRRGNVRSCGCLRRETIGAVSRTHGRSGMPEYQIWRHMLRRCEDHPADFANAYYYQRGIRVCERWLTFEHFYADMGPRPTGLTLERINNDGDYEPSNCKWATRSEQAQNRSKQ